MPIIILVVFLAFMLFLIAPSRRCRRADSWRGTSFAHRGLHGNGISENTLAAFELACRYGFGIELDVRLSSDGDIFVFHDDDLQRLTGDHRRVDAVKSAELQTLTLPDGRHIPRFEAVLQLVDGRVPLLIEFKNGTRNHLLCSKVIETLRNYNGPYLIESFNPLILHWFRRNAPQVIRGQLVGNVDIYIPQFAAVPAFLLSNLALNFLARPDFIAYDVSAKRFRSPSVQRILFNITLAPWTIKDQHSYANAIARGEMPIFEGFIPQNHT